MYGSLPDLLVCTSLPLTLATFQLYAKKRPASKELTGRFG